MDSRAGNGETDVASRAGNRESDVASRAGNGETDVATRTGNVGPQAIRYCFSLSVPSMLVSMSSCTQKLHS